MLRVKQELNLRGGTIIANPIPSQFEMNPETMERAINEALAQAKASGITGKDITPFLLAKVRDVTQGKSLGANCALLENNAALAADIAVALYRH
jgi:pseudouridine-5'-phosphate glycosidase